jgi:hypothetical protein
MAVSIGDRLARQAATELVGRAKELALLAQLLEPEGPLVYHLHGVGGIGKTSLLALFAAQSRAQGCRVVRLDCRSIEPTEAGFLHDVAAATGATAPTLSAIVEQLGAADPLTVLALDTYESFRLLDAWLRQVFIPALPDNVRLLLAGREAPLMVWLTTPGWHGLFRTLTLGPLDEDDAYALLEQASVPPLQAAQINRFARGYPLALRLALAAGAQNHASQLDAATRQRVVEQLSRRYLAEVHDPLTRRVLQAATVMRRATRGLLRAVLPDLDADDTYERLRALPFVEVSRDGLVIHDVVRQALAADLLAADPTAYRAYRRAVWAYLRDDVQQATRTELWRYTADMLYLLEAPTLREVFFPTDSTWFAIEPARADDWDAIRAISSRHDGPEATALLASWWRSHPEAFQVVRDGQHAVVAFYCLLTYAKAQASQLQADPLTRAWAQHLKRHPVAAGEQVLLNRRWLSRDYGVQPSPEQAAIFLDIKRMYMELRPQLRRIYVPALNDTAYDTFMEQVGFRELPEARFVIDGLLHATVMLDFGPGSVDGWLTELVGAQLAAHEPEVLQLDRDAHELVVDGKRVGLTQLECAVLQFLMERADKAVPRGDLLEDVWGYSYEGGSNVVDVVIGGLRKKLGAYATTIETVTKVGYRFRRP